MDVTNDKQHVKTVRDVEVGVTKNPVSYIVALRQNTVAVG